MRSYLITSPDYYGTSSQEFSQRLERAFVTHMPDFALYRDKESQNYRELAEVFVQKCLNFGIDGFLHQDIDLACELGAYGVHLTSQQFDLVSHAKDAGLVVCASAHSLEDIEYLAKIGAHFATFSPIFETPNKGAPKGIDELIRVVNQSRIPLFALGGIIDESHVQALEESGVYGFASIRYFID
ncbi:MAG: thiamine phosphate synthase [Epsilonproteobacteria bacterium]|nr:thiamine phosphate synthase [Campylobacterota bacterium]